MSAVSSFAPDAALVFGIAATAIPFARTPDEEAERWLRVLRLHGEVGAALQSLGVSEGSLSEHGERAAGRPTAEERRDVLALVSERAAQIADERGGDGVGTTEVLLAVLDVYGEVFERTLRAHGADSREVLERLGVERDAA